VVDSGSLEQETNIKPTIESAEPSIIAFFIGELFFNKQFVTSGFSRRIRAANSSFWRQLS
jgi:hypothetical protein